jgi:hypothetical protein
LRAAAGKWLLARYATQQGVPAMTDRRRCTIANGSARVPVYAAMALTSVFVFLGGLLPLFTQDIDALDLTGFCGVLLGGMPLLTIRTNFFYGLVTSGAGQDHPFAVWHVAVTKLLGVVMTIVVSLIVWRANTVGISGWKTGFLLFYGLFLFHVAGWLLRAPRFMLQELD